MTNTIRYAGELNDFFVKINELQKATRDTEFGFKIKKVLEAHDSLYDRFCPFKIGDNVKLTKLPEINNTVAPGWIGAKHFLIEGSEGEVVNRGYSNGLFTFGVTFNNESWLGQNGVENPSSKQSIFCLSEEFLCRSNHDKT